MRQDDPKTLVSTNWLETHLKDPDLRILDASWYLPSAGRDAKAEYREAHIPGARFFDIAFEAGRLPDRAPQQRIGGRQPAAEGGIELGRIAQAPGRVDVVVQAFGRRRIEHA